MWYLAIVMAISLTFSAVLYQATTGELERGLHRETERISSQFPVFEDSPVLRAGADYSSGAHRILLRLVGFNLIVLVTAGGASYWLARRTLQPIEDAHEQQKRFTADVSHELRTPLTALRMESEVALLNPKASSHELRNTLQSNLEEVGKLEALINNLLRLTHLEADALQQSFKQITGAELIDAAVKQVEPLGEERGIAITRNDKPSTLLGDKDGLVQLMVILLDNAIKYSPAKGSIEIRSTSSNQGLQVAVIDQGAGIERPALEHVFDRFYRADSSRQKNSHNGFGLGLSIAKMIADLHGATITLRSEVGKGTTAVVQFPPVSDKN